VKPKNSELIEFDRRPVVGEGIAGFVVAATPEVVLVHRLDWNTFSLDGYCAMRTRDIQRRRWLNRPTSWQETALRVKKIKPVSLPFVSADSFCDLLISISDAFSLITIHTELRDEGVCYVGRVKKLTDRYLVIFNLDTKAAWKGARRFRWADITRVDFGDGYAEALAFSVRKN
jgi:hypothetical protein